MGSAGPVVFVLFVAFMLYFIWSVKDVEPAELKMEWYAIVCPKTPIVPCVEKSKRVPTTVTPFECFRYGQTDLVPLLRKYPGWVVKKWGCRPATLGV